MNPGERAKTSEQMDKTGERAMRDIDIEYELSQSPAQVWRVLSEPELLARWLLPNDIVADVGHSFSLGSKSNRIDCEVLASEPGRLLSYSWRTDPSGGGLDTVLTFVLTETADGGTHLRLTHRGFPQPAQIVALRTASRPARRPSIPHSTSEVKMLWAA